MLVAICEASVAPKLANTEGRASEIIKILEPKDEKMYELTLVLNTQKQVNKFLFLFVVFFFKLLERMNSCRRNVVEKDQMRVLIC